MSGEHGQHPVARPASATQWDMGRVTSRPGTCVAKVSDVVTCRIIRRSIREPSHPPEACSRQRHIDAWFGRALACERSHVTQFGGARGTDTPWSTETVKNRAMKCIYKDFYLAAMSSPTSSGRSRLCDLSRQAWPNKSTPRPC